MEFWPQAAHPCVYIESEVLMFLALLGCTSATTKTVDTSTVVSDTAGSPSTPDTADSSVDTTAADSGTDSASTADTGDGDTSSSGGPIRYLDVLFEGPSKVWLTPSKEANPLNPDESWEVELEGGSIELTRDVVYGTWYDSGAKRSFELTMDIYAPSAKIDSLHSRAAILLLHPGAFKEGDKTDPKLTEWCAQILAPRGYVCASANYRMRQSTESMDTAMVDAAADAQAAIRFLRREATTYGIDPSTILGGGVSAGAGTILHAGWGAESAESIGERGGHGTDSDLATTSSDLSFIASFSGTTFASVIGEGGIDKDDPPTVFLHGDCDPVVPFSLMVPSYESALAVGVPAWLREYDGIGHCVASGFGEEAMDWLIPIAWSCVFGPGCPASAYSYEDPGVTGDGCAEPIDDPTCHDGPSYPL